jgi:hypothetical protein
MSRGFEAGAPQIDRRSFCRRTLITSAGVVLVTKALPGATRFTEQNLAVYPPQKIEGAKRLMPGAFLYFNYPKREDTASSWLSVASARTWGARSSSIQPGNVLRVRVTAGPTIRARAMSFMDLRLVRLTRLFCKFGLEVKCGPSAKRLGILTTTREAAVVEVHHWR